MAAAGARVSPALPPARHCSQPPACRRCLFGKPGASSGCGRAASLLESSSRTSQACLPASLWALRFLLPFLCTPCSSPRARRNFRLFSRKFHCAIHQTPLKVGKECAQILLTVCSPSVGNVKPICAKRVPCDCFGPAGAPYPPCCLLDIGFDIGLGLINHPKPYIRSSVPSGFAVDQSLSLPCLCTSPSFTGSICDGPRGLICDGPIRRGVSCRPRYCLSYFPLALFSHFYMHLSSYSTSVRM